jgi:hypothetical protein
MTAAACSTALLAFITLVYGQHTQRLRGDGVRISSADIPSWIQAWGLAAATAAKPAHSSLTCTRWSSTDRPAAWRSACSNSGYTCVGM